MGRPRKDVAQVGGGDVAVLAGPGYRKLPPCKFALKTPRGVKEYDALARKVFDAGRFTADRHLSISCIAKIFDQIAVAEDEDRPLRASWFTELRSHQRALSIDDLDSPIAAPAQAPVGKFARFGLPNRRER